MRNLIITTYNLRSLTMFRSALNDQTMQHFLNLLSMLPNHKDSARLIDAYADFAATLLPYNMNLTNYIVTLMNNSRTAYIDNLLEQTPIPSTWDKILMSDISILQSVSEIKSSDIKKLIPYSDYLPDWTVDNVDLYKTYINTIKSVKTNGFGMYAHNHMFTVHEKRILPVTTPDAISLSDFSGYEYERNLVYKNTLALLEGKPASNVLLYGDSGTGKSSTIKAIVNRLYPKGLRLIELKKTQLDEIPEIIELLGKNLLKFVLFIDDLSFAQEDSSFGELKAILEGSVLARTKNIAIYATSNRRHIIRESFSDRGNDDVHANETIQQTVSLSERFGLTIPFSTPKKQEYLDIVLHIANIYGLKLNIDDINKKAEIFALEKGGRSPRVARQFVEQLITLSD